MSPPHILLIVLDTLRRDHLDCYGYPRPTAPALADFAARAIRFERAISPAHWTLPAHASLFTGRYPTAHQLLQVESRLGHQHPTLAEILRTAGWRTAAFCNNPLLASLPCGLQRGFSHFYSYAGAVRHRPAPARAPARAWRRLMFPLQQRAARSSLLFRNALRPRLAPLWTQALSFKGDGPASVHDLIAWLRHQRAGHSAERHFVFLNLMGAHLPWRPAPATLRRIAPDSDPRALRYVRRFNARASRWLLPPEPPLAPQERQALLDAYDAEILQQDALLARLFRALRQMNALADTLVLIVADHGEAHGDHGFIGHGFGAHQELVQVPLILHDPDCRSAAGQVISAPVSTRRVFHTALVAAGLPPPLDESDPESDPESDLARLSLAQPAHSVAAEPLVFSEAWPAETLLALLRRHNPQLLRRRRLDAPRRAMYSDRHKLLLCGQDIEALYDSHTDPREQHDLAPCQPQLAARLHGQMLAGLPASRSRAPAADIDPATAATLRALGYLD